MKPRKILSHSTTPDGQPIELAFEAERYIIRVGGIPLMASGQHGSEEAMAPEAARRLAAPNRADVLIGGLGMGYTLRASLDTFGSGARITVAELLPQIVQYNREFLGDLARHPLTDPRVRLHEGDVRELLKPEHWDAILLDVDNGPDALTVGSNRHLYGHKGVRQMAAALKPGGVAVIWSAFQSPAFLRSLATAGLRSEAVSVRARGTVKKGPRHTLFIGEKPRGSRS